MDDIDKDTLIAERLNSPPSSSERPKTVAALIRRHYDHIQVARRAGKTWAEIGRDICPSKPIRADTVARSFARVSAERVGAPALCEPSTPRGTVQDTHVEEPEESVAQPNERVCRPNPFARANDPIRQLA